MNWGEESDKCEVDNQAKSGYEVPLNLYFAPKNASNQSRSKYDPRQKHSLAN